MRQGEKDRNTGSRLKGHKQINTGGWKEKQWRDDRHEAKIAFSLKSKNCYFSS